jgi:phage baseplate assembly protein W
MTLGTDFSGDFDLERGLNEVGGSNALALTQAIIRRLSTPLGSLNDFPEYGADLTQYIGTSNPSEAVIQFDVEEQCYQEEEVESVNVTVVVKDTSISVDISGTTAEGPFGLTVSVDELGVSSITPEA